MAQCVICLREEALSFEDTNGMGKGEVSKGVSQVHQSQGQVAAGKGVPTKDAKDVQKLPKPRAIDNRVTSKPKKEMAHNQTSKMGTTQTSI